MKRSLYAKMFSEYVSSFPYMNIDNKPPKKPPARHINTHPITSEYFLYWVTNCDTERPIL